MYRLLYIPSIVISLILFEYIACHHLYVVDDVVEYKCYSVNSEGKFFYLGTKNNRFRVTNYMFHDIKLRDNCRFYYTEYFLLKHFAYFCNNQLYPTAHYVEVQ